MNQIEFTVYGSPIAQPRQRHRIVDTGHQRFVSNYTPKRDPVNGWKSDVKTSAVVARKSPALWEGPLILVVDFYLPRPASKCRAKDPDGPLPHTGRPDTDNLIKAVKDALEGIIYKNDSQIYDEHPRKFYHEKSMGPRAVIRIEEMA